MTGPAEDRPAPHPQPGLDPAWSRFLTAPDAAGAARRWHVLDNGADPAAGTLLCVHGNPTWSYLWRRFLAAAPVGWRVLAIDQLGMGWSERPDQPRSFATRVEDLTALTRALGLAGRVVVLAHDWGGPIALGWALGHRELVAGLVLGNTAVAHPTSDALPGLIRLARQEALRDLVCVRTPAFVRGATALSRPALPRQVRAAFAAPYADRASRAAVGDFVADIPLEADHPSRAALEAVADGVRDLVDLPVLLLWGARDPVFTERYLDDLLDRLPQADVQRYPDAGHLVTEDVPETAALTWDWVASRVDPPPPDFGPSTTHQVADGPKPGEPEPADRLPWAGLTERADDQSAAVVELGHGRVRSTSFSELERRVRDLAAGLADTGVRAGERVALLVPPGLDLTVAVYACWRLGAVIVVADAGLGLRPLGRALGSARPDHVIGIGPALVAARVLRVPGRRIPVRRLADLEQLGRRCEVPPLPPGDPESAVLFTSGATGRAKGVVYRRSQLTAQIEAVRRLFDLRPDDRLVAAFAPFALYGPALGIGAVVPDMTVTAPGTLTAVALADAVAAVGATVLFASPAALRNVVATAADLSAADRAELRRLRLAMSAGAPVPVSLLRGVQQVLPEAELHTPYGMTEALPVTDISLAQIVSTGPGEGVCVGEPLPGVDVRVSPLDPTGRAVGALTTGAGVTGEICVAAAHVKDHYDRLWATERQSSRDPGWHRTGDVGHLDRAGRLWVEGRLVHLVVTADGPVTPVGPEQRAESVAGVRHAAAVGVGPAGTQQLVLVVVPERPVTGSDLAGPELSAAVRASVGRPVAAVLVSPRLPTDIRHNSKIDRAAVARWADGVLSGARAGRL